MHVFLLAEILEDFVSLLQLLSSGFLRELPLARRYPPALSEFSVSIS